jgi:hypothetical protein
MSADISGGMAYGDIDQPDIQSPSREAKGENARLQDTIKKFTQALQIFEEPASHCA